jgi:hypothetical protein
MGRGGAVVLVSAVFLAAVSTPAASARWCGVRAGSWRLMVLVPTR